MDELTKEFFSFIDTIQHCGCGGNFPVDRELVESVTHWTGESEPDGPAGWALFKLNDGRWGYFTESQDYTGHG